MKKYYRMLTFGKENKSRRKPCLPIYYKQTETNTSADVIKCRMTSVDKKM